MAEATVTTVYVVTRITRNDSGGAFMKNEGVMGEADFNLVKDRIVPAKDGADLFEQVRKAVT